jgi:hypothetical protein
MSLSNANRFWFNQGLNDSLAGRMIVSVHLTKKTYEGVHVPKFDDQNGSMLLGNTIKKDTRPSEIE